MARTLSNMIPLGSTAPDFNLYDPTAGTFRSLGELRSGAATVIMFICNHCPFVKHINRGIAAVAEEYGTKGISFIAINSNDVENYPDDSPENMKINAKEQGFTFPYLFDETQQTAKDYNAACTPDFFIFDKDMRLVYRGQFDDSRPGNEAPVTGADITKALDAVISGRPVDSEQIPSLGCNIKWKN